MTRSVLLYNPVSGTDLAGRIMLVERAAAILRGCGYDVRVLATTHAGSAGEQARLAVQDGAQVVFVCGGDGTIHEALQGVAGTQAVLAPIPMGRGNALCRELQAPLHPLRAAAAYRNAAVREVTAGECEAAGVMRYFLVMAGAGPDGLLMYSMLAKPRGRLGRWGYARTALRLLLRGRFPSFRVRYQTADGRWSECEAVSAMALRVGSLGGVFPGVARGTSLKVATMSLVIVRPPATLALPLWFLSAWLRAEAWNPWLLRCNVAAFTCEGETIHAEVDGEWMGRLPLSVRLGAVRVRLLVPMRLR